MMQTHPSALLLAAQLLHVIAWPFLEPSVVGRAAIGVIGMVAVAAAVYAVRRTPGVSRAVLFLGRPRWSSRCSKPCSRTPTGSC